jgi:hypothetical protein
MPPWRIIPPCIICCIMPLQPSGMFCIIARHCSGMFCIICPIGICPCVWAGAVAGGCTGAGAGCAWADGAAPAG